MNPPPATSTPILRLLRPDDAPAYVELRRLALTDAPWAFHSSPDHDRGLDAAGVARTLAEAGSAVAGAWWPGPAHGSAPRADAAPALASVAMIQREPRPKRAHVAWLMGVFTRPDARGIGLAERVCGLALDTARAWPGLAVVHLGVSEASPGARRLYERLGFVAWGHELDALRVDGRAYAEVHMRLDLHAPPA